MANNSGTGLHLSKSLLAGNQVSFLQNQGTAVLLSRLSSATFRGLRLQASQGRPAGLQLIDQLAVYCNGCEFEGNEGGAVQAESSSAVTLLNSVFSNNQAEEATLDFLLASPSVLVNCSFTANYATVKGTIRAMSTSLTFSNCLISNNQGGNRPGLVIIESAVVLADCVVGNQTGDSGYFLYVSSLSSVNLTRTWISLGRGSAVYVEESNLTFTSCRVADLQGEKGALLYAYSNANVTFLSSHFSTSTALNSGLVYLWMSSGYFHSTTFSAYQGSAIQAQQSSLLLVNCSFEGGRSEAGTGLYCVQCRTLSLQHCHFVGLQAVRGGAVAIEGGLKEAALVGCSFTDNRAAEGGGIYAHNTLLHIAESRFSNNSVNSAGPGQRWGCGFRSHGLVQKLLSVYRAQCLCWQCCWSEGRSYCLARQPLACLPQPCLLWQLRSLRS